MSLLRNRYPQTVPLSKPRTAVTRRAASASPSHPASLDHDLVQRKSDCACGGGCPRCANKVDVQTKAGVESPSDPHDTFLEDDFLNSPCPGQPLDPATRAFMEPRFGHEFGDVRIHRDTASARSAREINALAFTRGPDIFFAEGHYEPGTARGDRLLAHELSHVVQQKHTNAVNGGTVLRQASPPPDWGGILVDRQGPPPGWTPPTGTTCGKPSWCPPAFCTPYSNINRARYDLARNAPLLLLGIRLRVDSRVVPVWQDYLNGGTATQDFTTRFGSDFATSPETARVTGVLIGELRRALAAARPATSPATLDIPSVIPTAVAAINTPGDPNRMNFAGIGDIAGNLAGDIGIDQAACPAGALPSPINDSRSVRGTAVVTRLATGVLLVQPSLTYTVQDTVDLCPGNCGSGMEQIATVPFSQWEATGIAGDVPFTVEFSPAIPPFTIPPPVSP